MGKYSVEVKPQARKELEALPDELLARVVRKLDTLGDSPRPSGCKKLKATRISDESGSGDWRVGYIIDDIATVVSVTRVAHRREVYER